MTASSPSPIPAALLRKREKWLNAVMAGDIEAAIKAGGGKPEGPIGPEFLYTEIDNEIGLMLSDVRDRIKELEAEATAELSAYEVEKAGTGIRQRQAREKSISARQDEANALESWVDDVRMQRSPELPYFFASPAEVMLREGNLEGLKEVLRQWASPRQRYLRGFDYNNFDIGWTSPGMLPRVAQIRGGFDPVPLVILAAIRGDKASMQILVQAGLCPNGWGWWDEHDALLGLAEDVKKIHRDVPKVLKLYGMARGGLKAAAIRLGQMGSLEQELEDAFEPATYKIDGRKKALALLKKGAPVGFYPLARATDEGDIEMLEALFAAGGDPNCRYKSGVPMLAKLSKASLEAVKVWLRHGACPLMFHDPAEPNFGDDWCPSPLYEAVWEGNLDLTRLLLEQAVVRPVIAYKEGRKFVNPIADLAKERGHAKLVSYLKDYASAVKTSAA